jgi:hypothetical protein
VLWCGCQTCGGLSNKEGCPSCLSLGNMLVDWGQYKETCEPDGT